MKTTKAFAVFDTRTGRPYLGSVTHGRNLAITLYLVEYSLHRVASKFPNGAKLYPDQRKAWNKDRVSCAEVRRVLIVP